MISKGLLSFIIPFIFMIGSSYAQEDNYITTIKYHKGVVLPHHKSMTYIREDAVNALELNFGFIPSRERKWAALYNQPEIGLGFYHGNLGNDDVWGDVTSLFPYINFHILRIGQVHFINQFGLGLAYNNKYFHPTKNFKNIIISSKVNAFFTLALNTEIAISPQWQLMGGLGVKHISNGSSKQPNSGMNILTGNIGIKYALNNRPEITYNKIKKYTKLENEYSIAWNHGRKQAKENDLHRYYISNICANYAIGINAKQRLGFGIDLFYNKATNRGNWNYEPKTKFEDQISQGIHISHHLIISNFNFIIQLGAYTLYKTKPEAAVYSRVGLRYNIGQHFFSNFNLKAHGGKAENLEWGIGYRFTKKNNKPIPSNKIK
ncbi:acyloxyacyl hydrolase [Ancylomarina sp. YFZ004]